MPTGLEKQSITVTFNKGVDTKTDSKLVVPGSLLGLENGVFKKLGSISKRFGFDRLSNQTTELVEIPDPESGASFNDEALIFGAQKVYSYSENSEKWIDKGDAVSVIVNTNQVIKNTASQTISDSAVIDGIGIYAWEDSRGGVRASVFDEQTQTPILSDYSIDASASRPRCLGFNGFLFLFYYKSGSLYCRRLSPSAPNTFETAATISSTVNTVSPTYDVTTLNTNRMIYAHNVQGSTAIKVGLLINTPAADPVVSTATIADAATNCLTLVVASGSRIHVAYHNGTNGTRCAILNKGLASLHAPFTLDATTAPVTSNITGYAIRNSSSVRWFYEVSAAATYNRYIKVQTNDSTGTAGTSAVLLRSVGLASKAFVYYNDADTSDRAYFACVHESTLQSTYFVARLDGLIIAKIQPGLAYGLTSRPILANVNQVDTAKFSFSIQNKTRLISENSELLSLTGVAKTIVDFTNEQVFNTAQLGDNLHICGGILSMYDGASVVEHGFHLFPENITLAQSATGGSLADGAYQVAGVYEWTDNQGQRHQSAPSVPTSITVSGGGSSQKITVTFPTLRLTQKKSPRSNVVLSVYMTLKNETTFYKKTTVASPVYNDPTADSVAIELLTEPSLSNEILYTTGGVLENIAAPSCSTLTTFRGRLILCGLENPNEWWYSKLHVKGEPVAFSDAFSKILEPDGGGITGPWVLDDKLLLFKRQRIYVQTGEGPPDTGDLNQFSEPELINSDTGCSNWNSIVDMPAGVMRKTDKGIYSLGSNLVDEYVGAQVEAYNSETITSANPRSDANQVRFTTAAGPCLVYDYFTSQWSTFTGFKANDAFIWRNRDYVLLRDNGAVLKENTTIYKDNGASAPLKVTTGWIGLAGVMGFQRVYWLNFLGEYKSSHKLIVRVGYDFSDSWSQSIIFDPDEELDVNVYGDGATYGSISPYGGNDGCVYRFRSRLTRQKCQAVRFQIEELVSSSTDGTQEGLVLTALALEVGMKRGTQKLKTAQTRPASTGGV
jgi:hypothetical protein